MFQPRQYTHCNPKEITFLLLAVFILEIHYWANIRSASEPLRQDEISAVLCRFSLPSMRRGEGRPAIKTPYCSLLRTLAAAKFQLAYLRWAVNINSLVIRIARFLQQAFLSFSHSLFSRLLTPPRLRLPRRLRHSKRTSEDSIITAIL